MNHNFIIDVNSLDNQRDNEVLDHFLFALKENFDIYFSKTFSLDTNKIRKSSFEYNEIRTVLDSDLNISYLPVYVENNQHNDYLILASISRGTLSVVVKRIKKDANKALSFSLRSYTKYLKNQGLVTKDYDTYVAQRNSKGEVIAVHNLFELTNNLFEHNMASEETIFKFNILDKKGYTTLKDKLTNQKDMYWETAKFNRKYSEIKGFIRTAQESQIKQETADSLTDEFNAFVTGFGLKTEKDFDKLFQLDQVCKKKSVYELFVNLTKTHNTTNKLNLSSLISSFYLNKIAVLTPEYGEFMKVGGLAVMIEDLINEMTNYDEEFVVLIPYYNIDKKKNHNYLLTKGAKYLFNITVSLHSIDYQIGIHELKREKITFYFLHNVYLFPAIYPSVS